MLSYLKSAFARGVRNGKVQNASQQRQARPVVRPTLESLEDRYVPSTMAGVGTGSLVGANAFMQGVQAFQNMEQQMVQAFAQQAATILTAEAQLVSPYSPPLASLLQSEAQFFMSFLPQSSTADPAASSGVHEYPIPPSNIFPHPYT